MEQVSVMEFILKNFSSAREPKLQGDILSRIISIQDEWVLKKPSSDDDKELQFLATRFTEEELQEIYSDKGGDLIVAYQNETVVGFLLITDIQVFTHQYETDQNGKFIPVNPDEPLCQELSHCRYLYQVVVKKGLTHAGIGSAMMKLAKSKCSRLIADVLMDPYFNKYSYDFFIHQGFRVFGDLHLSGYRDFGSLRSKVLIHSA